MKNIKVLDVTLRDGGCVNNFDFGQNYMDQILSALEKSNVEYIELGYIDDKKGCEKGRTQYINEKVISQHFLKSKNPNKTYVVMMDYGKFDVDKLGERTQDGIDGIRCAFHKKDWKEALKLGRKIIDKGYKFFIQPMITMRYSDSELIELINAVNNELPDASGFYIVDSFGEMRENDVVRLLHLVDNNLIPKMIMGFHSHNNLQLSYANAMAMLNFSSQRDLMLDASIMGMGKGAGNLNTELLLEHLNLYHGKSYKIAPLLEVIDKVINVIHKEMYWGYSVEYYLSSVNRCTPSYASYFYNKQMLSIDAVAELLGMIDESKKISFDKQYAEQLYLKFNERDCGNDEEVVEKLRSYFENKKVLVVAPGKSILNYDKEIQGLIEAKDVVSVSLNHVKFDTEFIMVTRNDGLKSIETMGKNIIATTNMQKMGNIKNLFIIDYKKWITFDEVTHDSSSVILLNLLKEFGVKEVVLAGFDGFSINSHDNYYDADIRKSIKEVQAKERNDFYSNYFNNLKKNMNISFLTPSLYE